MYEVLDGRRIGYFVMNAMLASGGYGDTYLAAIESASIGMDIGPFARFVAERVAWLLE